MFGKKTCRCRVCGVHEVEYEGAVCELCALGKDTNSSGYGSFGGNNGGSYGGNGGYGSYGNSGNGYGSNGGNGGGFGGYGGNNSGYGNTGYREPAGGSYGGYSPNTQGGQVSVYGPGEVMQNNPGNTGMDRPRGGMSNIFHTEPISQGIVRNVGIGNEKHLGITKYFKSLFTGAPYCSDNFVTTFQVYPDEMGSGFNSSGFACDQVVLYGKLTDGMISDNNEVAVYGHRDPNGCIIASKVINRSSGATMRPQHLTPAWVVRLLTVIALAACVIILATTSAENLLLSVILVLVILNLPLLLKILKGIFSVFKFFFDLFG